MQLYDYHLAQRAADILRWQDGPRQDGLHADEERLQPRQLSSLTSLLLPGRGRAAILSVQLYDYHLAL